MLARNVLYLVRTVLGNSAQQDKFWENIYVRTILGEEGIGKEKYCTRIKLKPEFAIKIIC